MILYVVLGVVLVALLVLTVLWLRQRKKQKQAQAGGTADQAPGGDEISLLIREAEAKLSAAKLAEGARVGQLPVYIVMGEAGSTKTSVMLHSGLEAELIAGQVYQNGNVTATRAANVWFSRRSLFVEAGGHLAADAPKWSKLIARLAPRSALMGKGEQAPRAALVCFDCEVFTRAGAQEAAVNSARALRARLGEISQAMGINLPVYVLFTKADRVPFFTEFFRNLTNDEAGQVLGVTLPMLGRRNEGVYGDEETARLTGNFERLFRSLADARPEFLSRETDGAKLPATYEFPREFRKLRATAVQFLVDLCRPSQLTVGPFLRGFYFTGVRPVLINESAPVAPAAGEAGGYGAASGATGIFHAGGRPQAAAPAPQRAGATRKVPQWVFLGHLFHSVLLGDRGALGASGSSTKTSRGRRILLAVAAGLCLLLATAFTVSFFRNHGLEARVRDAAQGIASGESTGADMATLPSLQKLETLRQSLETLAAYHRDGAPWSYRWGLYAGDDLYPEARRVYFARFKQLLFGQTQGNIQRFLSSLPATPGPDYGSTYSALKAYLITTSFHDKSTREFLAPVLLNWWVNGQGIDPDRQSLAQKQFEYYAEELQTANPFSSVNDSDAIEHARHYLAQFAGEEAVYAFLLAEAGKNNPPIDFNRQFPGSAQTVVETHEVPGAFSKGGWAFMKDALNHVDRYINGERWVLGEQAQANIDKGKLAVDLRARYNTDFTDQWRTYIKSANVVRYTGLKDASQKLRQLSGNQSALLALLCVASQNTSVDDAGVAGLFQPVQSVTAAPCSDKYIQGPNQNYMTNLLTLQTTVDQVASQPGPPNDAAASTVQGAASAAKLSTGQMAQAFRPDPDGHVDTGTRTLLEEPITYIDALVRTLGPAELNGKGKDLCAQMRPLLAKYPFTPSSKAMATLADIDSVFKPKDGLLWQFYDQNLQKAIVRVGSQFSPASSGGMTINPSFLGFLNRAAAFADAAYANNSPDPHFNYTVRLVPLPDTESARLTVDGKRVEFSAADPSKTGTFAWPGAASGVQLSVKVKGGSDHDYGSYDGLWAIFQLVDDADLHQGTQVEIAMKRGKSDTQVTDNGRPVRVRFDLQSTPSVFERGYFAGMSCVAEVARP
ncbi:MAG: ImcF-related family protein [Bryobacteraceae bacterium]